MALERRAPAGQGRGMPKKTPGAELELGDPGVGQNKI